MATFEAIIKNVYQDKKLIYPFTVSTAVYDKWGESDTTVLDILHNKLPKTYLAINGTAKAAEAFHTSKEDLKIDIVSSPGECEENNTLYIVIP